MTTSDGADMTKAVLPAEIWNPDTETWTTVASAAERARLPLDGAAAPGRARPHGGRRSARRAGAANQNNAEIYSPPYLFKGPRPTITASPRRRRLRRELRRLDAERRQIAKVSLIRSPSVTHAFDMNQRFQFLNFTPGTGKVTVTAPGERQPRAARRLPALPRRHERRSVGGNVRPAVDERRHRRRRRRRPA